MIKLKTARAKLTIALFILPALILYTVFQLIPIAGGIYFSFMSWDGLAGSALKFVDLVYAPKETSFMKEFIKRDKKAISGLDMLINQGIISFELWNKIKIDEASRIKAKKEVEKFLGEV